MTWDVFISHASEDKEQVVVPLAASLTAMGFRVWLDKAELLIGDSLRAKIDEGLSESRFGIVVISQAFMAKDWPQKELDGLIQKELDGRKVILPVWHAVTRDQVAKYSLILASKFAGTTADGIDTLAEAIARAIAQSDGSPRATAFANRIEIAFAYQVGTRTRSEHKYQLLADITLNTAPALDGLRLEFLWPHRVSVIASVGVQRMRELRVGLRDYVEYGMEIRQKVFPGQRLRLIGENAVFMYAVSQESFGCIEFGDMLLRWRLLLPDGMPIDGEVNLKDLNEF